MEKAFWRDLPISPTSIAKKVVDGQEVPCEGELYYRGYNIKELVKGFLDADHYGFEEITYLLLFGELPDEKS